ncbi:hypothetical protein JCM11641_003290 [Rhodosporidiobolus odoratus]
MATPTYDYGFDYERCFRTPMEFLLTLYRGQRQGRGPWDWQRTVTFDMRAPWTTWSSESQNAVANKLQQLTQDKQLQARKPWLAFVREAGGDVQAFKQQLAAIAKAADPYEVMRPEQLLHALRKFLPGGNVFHQLSDEDVYHMHHIIIRPGQAFQAR